MAHFNEAFINFTWVLLPIVIYLIYEVYTENINKNKDDLVLGFCLFSSLYFMFRFGTFANVYVMNIVFDYVALLLYKKKKRVSAIIISLFIVFLYYFLNLNFYVIFFKFLTYVLFSFLFKSRRNFLLLSYISGLLCLIIFGFLNDVIISSLFEYIVYYSVCYLIVLFLLKAEKIIEINVSYKELMKENQLRESLFKISHEIKNPIAVCKGYLETILRNIFQFLSVKLTKL